MNDYTVQHQQDLEPSKRLPNIPNICRRVGFAPRSPNLNDM